MLGERPPYPELRDRVEELIRKTDFIQLYTRNLSAANIALITASTMAYSMENSSLTDYLKEKIKSIASHFCKNSVPPPDEENPNPAQNIQNSLLEAIAWLSSSAGEREKSATEFSNQLGNLVRIWPELFEGFEHFVNSLFRYLPSSESKEFVSLFLRYREK